MSALKRESSFSVDLRCPDDGHLLRAAQSGKLEFFTCRHCPGAWFTREMIDRGGKWSDASDVRLEPRIANRHRSCPRCSVHLDPKTEDNVVIDVCPECAGVWLDPGDYRAARRRSVRLRIEREMPSYRQPTRMTAVVDLLFEFVVSFATSLEFIADDRRNSFDDEPLDWGVVPKARRHRDRRFRD